ncbi:MAG: hypothetical protein H6559_18695 [Lewinellaceae bacterium]|nr:hypothetical protein [Lewinellaceae bacterium]
MKNFQRLINMLVNARSRVLRIRTSYQEEEIIGAIEHIEPDELWIRPDGQPPIGLDPQVVITAEILQDGQLPAQPSPSGAEPSQEQANGEAPPPVFSTPSVAAPETAKAPVLKTDQNDEETRLRKEQLEQQFKPFEESLKKEVRLSNNDHDLTFSIPSIKPYEVNEEGKRLKKLLDSVKSKYDSTINNGDRTKLSEILNMLLDALPHYAERQDILKLALFFAFDLHQWDKAIQLLIRFREEFDDNMFHWLSFFANYKSNLTDQALYHLRHFLAPKPIHIDNPFFQILLRAALRNVNHSLALFGLLEDKIGNKDLQSLTLLTRAVSYLMFKKDHSQRASKLYALTDANPEPEQIRLEIQDAFSVLNNVSEVEAGLNNQLDETEQQQEQFQKEVKEMARRRQVEVEQDKRNPLLPPMGYIIEYNQEMKSGNIQVVNSHKQVHFNHNSIKDSRIIEQLTRDWIEQEDIPVIYIPSHNKYNLTIPIDIRLPVHVNEILDEVDELIGHKNFYKANQVIDLVLRSFPANEDALEMQNKIVEKHQAYRTRTRKARPTPAGNKSKNKSANSPYNNAKRFTQKKNFEKAIEQFEKAIEEGDRLESAIKDLAMLHHQMKETEKGILVLEDNMHKISEKGPAYNVLVNLTYAAGKYEQAIEYLDKADRLASQDRKPFILRTYGLCHLKLANYDQAEVYFKQLLSYKRDDAGAQQALEAIAQYRNSGNVDLLKNVVDTLGTESIEELSLSSELSLLLKRAMAQNNYEGVPESFRANQNFSPATLRNLRVLIKEAGRARPEERARYLLTEAKLMQQFEPDKTIEFKAVLARYCNAMALLTAGQNYPNSVVRYYYLEAFNLEDSWDSLVRQVGVYISSYTLRGIDLVKIAGQNVRSDAILEKIFSQVPEEKHAELWDGTLDMFIANREITSRVLDIIKQNKTLFASSVRYLRQNNPSLGNLETEEELNEAWLKMRSERSLATNNLMVPYKAVQNESVLQEAYEKLTRAGREIQNTDWLLKLDKSRAQQLNDIGHDIDKYFRATSFDAREHRYQLLEQKTRALLNEIEQQPTLFSVRTFIPLCEFLQNAFKRDFEEVVARSKPKIEMSLLNTDTAIGKDDTVEVRLLLENERESSPIQMFQLTPIGNEDCKPIDGKIVSNDIIRGGEKKEVHFRVRITPQAKENRTARLDLHYLYGYNKGQAQEERNETLNLKLYSESEFVRIENPYARIAESGPVEDESMFFGRDELIRNIIDTIENAKSKCVLLFGQKRSGKSSVLYHINEKLKASGRAISIKFSIGDIIGSPITNFAFFYKICREIENYFLDLPNNPANPVPEVPPIVFNDFKELPSIHFDGFMNQLRRNLAKTPGWENRHIVLCIDEFTYLYTAIRRGTLDKEFMKTIKSILEKGYFSAILVGQDVMQKFKSSFPNEFGVTEDKRLTYLDKKAARALVEKPIWDEENHKSRYIGDAVDGILEWTASNPYYLQMFCARLVDRMNANKYINITRLDVDEVATEMFSGNKALQKDKFDNLLTGGDADVEQFKESHVLGILKSIAGNSKTHQYCTRDQINTIVSKEEDDKVIEDLIRREVLELLEDKYYKISVKLFEKWLLV